MPSLLSAPLQERRPFPRIFLWILLAVINVLLWLLLLAFHWELSLRSREVSYFGTQLFPLRTQPVPLPYIYAACALLTAASTGAILRDHRNLTARERIRSLLFQILDSLEIGVVVLDSRNLLIMANGSARQLLPEIPSGYANLDATEVLKGRPRLLEILTMAAKEGKYYREIEHDLRTPGDPLPVRITTLPLKDPQKHVTGTLLLVHDVREAMRMERQMRSAERLSALGTLAAAMAHEIRNPLEAMDLNLALLERNLPAAVRPTPDADRVSKYVEILESEIARLAGIVDNFLSFARPTNPPMGEIRVDELLRQIVDLLVNQAGSGKVSIALSIEEVLLVFGSRDQLKQAFLNLFINSLEAMPDGGTLTIHAGAGGKGRGGTTGETAVVRIQDTGKGILPEHLPRLFDPFFTARPTGTGLGLTIARRIIQEHRGQIRVASVPGAGATFEVFLPLGTPEKGRNEEVRV
jgi:signal transduction histidine kinase